MEVGPVSQILVIVRQAVRRSAVLFSLSFVMLVSQTGRLVGQDVGVADSSSVDESLAAVERARLHLRARDFAAAYDAAAEAASEAGLSPSSPNLVLPDSFDVDAVASILLYRGLSLELQRQFPEAAADYNGFLRLEPGSPRSRELRERLPYVEVQSVRTLARRFRDDGEVPPTDAFEGGARFALGVFPLFNESSLLAMSQMAFGLTGVLRNALSLLDSFSDLSLPSAPLAHLRWLLDEILPQEVYAEAETVPVSELTRVLDTDYLVVGTLNEVVGSLTANLTIGRAVSEEGRPLGEIQSSYSQAGVQNLQLDLVLALADSIQSMTGFVYTPSREAFIDSLRPYLIADVDQFLDYGYVMEQLLIGDPVEGRVLLLESSSPLAQLDLAEVAAVFSGDTPPADNLFLLTSTSDEIIAVVQAAYEDSVAAAAIVAAADTLRKAPIQTADAGRAPKPSRRTGREVLVVSATAAQVLGPAGIGMPRLDVFGAPGFPTGDSRAGKSGTLDPTRQKTGVPIRIEIPVPREAPTANASEK